MGPCVEEWWMTLFANSDTVGKTVQMAWRKDGGEGAEGVENGSIKVLLWTGGGTIRPVNANTKLPKKTNLAKKRRLVSIKSSSKTLFHACGDLYGCMNLAPWSRSCICTG